MSYPGTITGRVIAVLDQDGIPDRHRAAHLRDTCGISISAARRLLHGQRIRAFFNLVQGLDVDLYWLHDGDIQATHARTARIHLERIKGYPPEVAALMQRLAVGFFSKHTPAKNLIAMVESGQLSMKTAAQLYAQRP
jgi:hypothetical protein